MKTLNSMFGNISDKHFVMVSAAFASVKAIFDTYIFSDWQFVTFLMVLIIVDTLLGTYNAYKKKKLESRAYARLFEKILLYAGLLILTHVLMRFPVAGAATGLFNWLDDTLYCAIMVREALSIFENIAEIKPNFLPIWLVSRFKKFDETGQFKDLM